MPIMTMYINPVDRSLQPAYVRLVNLSCIQQLTMHIDRSVIGDWDEPAESQYV